MFDEFELSFRRIVFIIVPAHIANWLLGIALQATAPGFYYAYLATIAIAGGLSLFMLAVIFAILKVGRKCQENE